MLAVCVWLLEVTWLIIWSGIRANSDYRIRNYQDYRIRMLFYQGPPFSAVLISTLRRIAVTQHCYNEGIFLNIFQKKFSPLLFGPLQAVRLLATVNATGPSTRHCHTFMLYEHYNSCKIKSLFFTETVYWISCQSLILILEPYHPWYYWTVRSVIRCMISGLLHISTFVSLIVSRTSVFTARRYV